MATLKISDLSVGDWVMVECPDGERWRGRLIRLSVTGGVEVCCANGKHVRCSSDFISSIPATAEILEANGIHRTYEDDKYAIFRGDGLWAVKYSDGDWELSMPPVCRVDIKYVHQLQHALRLAGVGKEINL